MKNLLFALILFLANTLLAQSTSFHSTLTQNLSQITPNSTAEEWQTLGISFEQIAVDYPKEWLAHYYTAYAYLQLAGTYEDQTRPIVAQHLDKAQASINQAKTLVANHAEILVLQGFIYVARIWESPYLNGGLYGRKISKLFKQAIVIDSENPRAYYLKGILTYHTPRFVGGGKEKAKPWLVTANEKFESFNFDSDVLPYWGALENQALLVSCGGVDRATAGQ